jgi:hypothetical protein
MSTRYDHVVDAALNDSNKTFTVPVGQVWLIDSVFVELIASVEAGTRRMRLTVEDENGVVYVRVDGGATFIASATQRVHFFVGAQLDTTEVVDTIRVPIPPLRLLPGHVLTVLEGTATDAAIDDMTVAFTRNVQPA